MTNITGELIQWPEKPTCHGDSPRFSTNGVNWRAAAPDGKLRSDTILPGYGYPFRACSYCGSIHPEDLITLLDAGARLGGSDWKYGWPHKFYVEKIPNPLAGQDCSISSSSCGAWTREQAEAEAQKSGSRYQIIEEKNVDRIYHNGVETTSLERTRYDIKYISPAPQFTHGKFYNDHVTDEMSDAARAKLCEYLERFAGITFEMKDELPQRDTNDKFKFA